MKSSKESTNLAATTLKNKLQAKQDLPVNKTPLKEKLKKTTEQDQSSSEALNSSRKTVTKTEAKAPEELKRPVNAAAVVKKGTAKVSGKDSGLVSTTELPKSSSTTKLDASSDAAIDAAWKKVKSEKFDEKGLPNYKIPATDLEDLKPVAEIPKNGSEATNATLAGTNQTTTDAPQADTVSPLEAAVALEKKQIMDKQEAEKEKEKLKEGSDAQAPWSWEFFALAFVPIALLIVAIFLGIRIRQRMNEAKGRSVVYELTAELGKKNNEKPVVST